MSEDERRQRALELMRKSRQALEETELVDRNAKPEPSRGVRREEAPKAADDGMMMYRGRPVRRPGGSGKRNRAQGADFRGTAARGGANARRGDDVRGALEKLTELYESGLISRAELDKKRQQILDRL